MCRVANVKVPGEENVGSAARHRFHRHSSASDQVPFVVSLRQIERMMSDDDFNYLRIENTEPLAHKCDLVFVNATALDRQRTCRVDSQHRDFFVMVKRPQIVGDKAAVLAQRL